MGVTNPGQMRYHLVFFLVLLLPAVSALELPPLKPQGRWFSDPEGRITLLRGVNQVNKRPPYDHQSLGFDSRHASFLQAEGFNVVRLGVMWAAVEPVRGRYDRQYLTSIGQTVDMLCQHGIYSLLDLHQDAYGTRTGGAGFPEWASLGQGQGCGVHGFPLCYFRSQATIEDFDNFWANTEGVQDGYLAMLKQLVGFFSGRRGCVLGIELMNEPFPGSGWPACGHPNPQEPVFGYNFSRGCEEFESTNYTDFIGRTVEAARKADPSVNVFYTPTSIAGVGGGVHIRQLNTSHDRLAFSYHNYLRQNFRAAFDHAEDHQVVNDAALILTEFGANVDPGYWSEAVELGDEYMSSWVYWAYTNNPPYNFSFTDGALPSDPRRQGLVYNASLPPEGGNVDMARVAALARPYIRHVAGRPLAMEYQPLVGDPPRARFSCRWSTAGYNGLSAVSELYLPPRVFPPNSVIVLTGAVLAPGPTEPGIVKIVNNPSREQLVTVDIYSQTAGSSGTTPKQSYYLGCLFMLLFSCLLI